MPQRPFNRDQCFLLLPSLDDLVAPVHPVRFVAAWLDELTAADWRALGIDLTPARQGEARYAPQALLAIWVYGFMVGIRSTRALEAACRDQLPFRWLSGNQTPDHNTLARFYQRHRSEFHHLFRRTVHGAVAAELVDWAVQAVDGTKIRANAAGDRMLDADALAALDARITAAIAELDADTGDGPGGPPALPAELGSLTALQTRVRQAQARLDAGRAKGNLTDPDAHQMTARGGNCPAYNAQAAVVAVSTVPDDAPDDRPDDPNDGASGDPSARTSRGVRAPARRGRLIVAIEVRTRPDDHGVLPEVLAQATDLTGQPAAVTLADAGYYSGADLVACAEQGAAVVIPEPRTKRQESPYGPDAFAHDPATDTLTCPQGVPLRRWGPPDPTRPARYAAPTVACQRCEAKAVCCPKTARSRVVVRSPQAELQARADHRAWMATEAAHDLRRQRAGLIEPVFGTLKTRHGARQWLLRGLPAVRAEWTLLATAFNLQTLWRLTQGRTAERAGRTPTGTPANVQAAA